MPQKIEYIRFVRPPTLKGESLYSQDTVPKAACWAKLQKYSKAAPTTMLAMNISTSRWLYILRRNRVMATAPKP